MAMNKPRSSSFSRNVAAVPSSQVPGLKHGPNGTIFLSSGISDLDRILGGGFALGSLVLVMEDSDAPHHMLMLRNFMSQGLVHNQPLLYASPAKEPRSFLGTLPAPVSSKDNKSRHDTEQEKALRIAWQYKKYSLEQTLDSQKEKWKLQLDCMKWSLGYVPHAELIEVMDQLTIQTRRETIEVHCNSLQTSHILPILVFELMLDDLNDGKAEYCNDFDLKRPLERHALSGQHVDCVSLQNSPTLATLHDRCSAFLAQLPRYDGNISSAGRMAIQSLCAPDCEFSDKEWEVLGFVRSLKSMVRSSNAVAVITFPSSLISSTTLKRWQHLADIVLSVKAIPDEDKELAQLLTGYQDMLGLLSIHKVARFNTQVPTILEATTFSMKLKKRKILTLECLNQAPVDGSSGSSYATSGSCSVSSKSGSLDF